MGLKLREKFFNVFFSNKVESFKTRQIEIRHHKTNEHEHSFSDSALLLTFRLSQFLGILPIYIQKRISNTYLVTISPLIYVLNILICLLINGVILYSLYLTLSNDIGHIHRHEWTHTRFMETKKYIVFSVVFFLSVLNIFSTFYGIIRVRRILDCLKSIKKIKQRVNNGSYQCKENRRKMCSVILLATFSPIIFNITATGFSWKYFYVYLFTILSVMVFQLEVQFLLLVDSLNSSFEAINKQLKEIVSHLNFYYIERIHRKKISLRIRQLMISFVDSCNMLKKINSNESLLLLGFVILFPLYIIFSFFFLFHALSIIGDATSIFISVVYEVFNCFFVLLFVCFIIQPCHQTQKEVNKTKHLIAEIMCHIKSEDDPLFDSVDSFYKQLLLNHYAFTAMGFCDLGRPLISKIFGLACTLLMVIKF